MDRVIFTDEHDAFRDVARIYLREGMRAACRRLGSGRPDGTLT